MKHTCPDLDALIDLARDGTGPEEVVGHVATCPTCQREVEFLREVRSALAARVADSPEWLEETLAQLPPADAPPDEPPRWRSRVASLPASALAFVTVVFACLVGGVLPGPAALGLALAAAVVAYAVDRRIPYSEGPRRMRPPRMLLYPAPTTRTPRQNGTGMGDHGRAG